MHTNTLAGIVTRSTGSWYDVWLIEQKRSLPCRVKGKLRLLDLPLTNPIAVGDRVVLRLEADEQSGMIEAVQPRQNYIVRQSPHNRKHLHLLAANIDQAILLVTLKHPRVKIGFMDRFLLAVESQQIPALIVFNKADLYEEEELEQYLALSAQYTQIGYRTLLVSAQTGEGLDALRQAIQGKDSLLCGHSGVGKSSLVNALQPNLTLRTQEVSDYSNKGQHTTTFAERFLLDIGGSIIDSPGIKEWGLINFSPQEVAHNFREFFEHSPQCKFGGQCLHLTEPRCAVRAGLEDGSISALRYQSYVYIMAEVQEQNDWERQRDW